MLRFGLAGTDELAKRSAVRMIANRAAGTTYTIAEALDAAEDRSEEATGGCAELNSKGVRK